MAPPRPNDKSLRLQRALAAAAASSEARVRAVEIDGRRYWIKRRERLTGRLRLQKGDTGRAFERERAALKALADRLRVPRLVAEGPEFFAITDAGPNLQHIARTQPPGQARTAIFAAAGGALAMLHRAGHAHGRPAIRDFCWSGDGITLIDFERYFPRGNTPRRIRNDLVILVHSAYAEFRKDTPEIDALCAAYRETGPHGTWEAAVRLCRRIRWVAPLTRPLRGPGRKRAEFTAIPLTLQRFGAT